MKNVLKKNKTLTSILILFCLTMFFSIKGTTQPLTTADEVGHFILSQGQVGIPLEFSRARTQYIQILSLYRDNTLEFTTTEALLTTPDVGFLNRKLHSMALPGISFLMYPFFLLGNMLGLGQLISYIPLFLIHGFNIVLFFFVLRKMSFDEAISSLGSLIFGFGTLALPYATVPLYHTFTFTGLFLCMLYTLKLQEDPLKNSRYLGYTMICMSIIVFIDYPIPLILLPFFLYQITLLRKKDTESEENNTLKTLLKFSFAPILGISSLLLLHHNLFDDIFQTTNTQAQFAGLKTLEIKEEYIQEYTKEKKTLKTILKKEQVPMNGLRAFFLNKDSVFVLSPLLLLGAIGIIVRRRKISLHPVLIPTLLGSIVSIILYSSFVGSRGGESLGVRYFMTSAPVFIIFILFFIKEIKKNRLIKNSFLLLLFWTFLSHFSGLFTTISSLKWNMAHRYGIMQFNHLISETTSSFWFTEIYSGIPLIVYPVVLASITTLMCYRLLKTTT